MRLNDEFYKAFANPRINKKLIKYAMIDPNYQTGKPRLIYDGEQTPTVKTFVYLASYTPVANDRVMVIQDVIVGKIIN